LSNGGSSNVGGIGGSISNGTDAVINTGSGGGGGSGNNASFLAGSGSSGIVIIKCNQ
jgi:hypothetical protein